MKTERAGVGGRRPAAGPTVDLLVDLATRFYITGQSQVQIARSLGLDPSTVSRYLKRARDERIVTVDIRRPRSLQGDLALELAETFSLKKAVVVAGEPGGGSNDAVAWAAADYVNSRLMNRMKIGLSWGRMLAAAIHMLPAGTASDLDISLLHGGVGSAGAGIQGHELARHLASLNPRSRVHYLHAPVLVDSADIKDAMLRDGSIRAALEAAASAELALVGIGSLDESAPLIHYGHISPRDRKRLLAAGAVGDMCTRFFNLDGEPVHVLDERLIAIQWEELKRIPLVVAMAAGLQKRDAILGALRVGAMNVLITDEPTARAVLRAGRRSG